MHEKNVADEKYEDRIKKALQNYVRTRKKWSKKGKTKKIFISFKSNFLLDVEKKRNAKKFARNFHEKFFTVGRNFSCYRIRFFAWIQIKSYEKYYS